MPQHFLHERKEYGTKQAFLRMRRRHKGTAAYLLLAAAIAFSFQQERQHSNSNRAAIAQGVNEAIYEGCERSNDLRAAFRGIILEQIPSIKQGAKGGVYTQKQTDAALKEAQHELAVLADVPCSQAAQIR